MVLQLTTENPMIVKLRGKAGELLATSEAILQRAESEDRGLKPEEEKLYQDTNKAIDGIMSQISLYEDLDKRKLSILNKTVIAPSIHQPPKVDLDIAPENGYFSGQQLTCFRNQDGSDNLEKAFKFGCFLAAVVYKMPRYIKKLSQMGYDPEKLAMGTSATLVPPEFSNEIIRLRNTYGSFRRNARFRSMASGTLNFPRQTGNVTVSWVDENAAIPDSDMTFANVQLVAKKLSALTRYSRELDEDAMINVGDEIATDMAYGMARGEDLAGFLGDGTATYGGIEGILTLLNDGNHDASLFTAAAGKDTVAELDELDFIEVIARLPNYAIPFAKWYCSSYAYAMGMLRQGHEGGGTNVVSIREGLQFQFMGFPVEIANVMPGAGMAAGAVPFLFGALRFSSSLGERRGFTLDTSTERYFEYDQIGIKAVERIDIENHDLGTDTEAGPVIGLKLAAA